MTRFFVGITGASGHAYAEALIRSLLRAGHELDLAPTRAGCLVLRHELGVEAGEEGERLQEALPKWLGEEASARVRVHRSSAVGAPPSSGTSLLSAVILCPCSMGTLARVRAGFSSNLVERAADVALKEGRRLILVPRESPLSAIHLENMLALARLGATILPAMPGFYQGPTSLADLVDHVVQKILDRLGEQTPAARRWAGLAEPEPEQGIEQTSATPGLDQKGGAR